MATRNNTHELEMDADAYEAEYLATEKLLIKNVELYNAAAENSPTVADRERYKAMALDASREYELLRSRRRAYLKGDSLILRPTIEEILSAQAVARNLAVLISKQQKVEGILDTINKAILDLNKVSATT